MAQAALPLLLAAVVTAAHGGGAAGAGSRLRRPARSKPNLVMLFVDDLGYGVSASAPSLCTHPTP